MAIGIFGGTFDPIHNGHLITTRFVLEQRNLEKIIFIPSFISPLKQNFELTNNLHRLQMVKIAIDSIPYFEVNDLELKRESVSYTIDTIRELNKIHRDIELIIGYDNLLLFEHWHEPDEIIKLVKVVVLKRHIDEIPDVPNRFFDNVTILESPHIEISATNIRNRIKNNLPVDFMVPDKVNDYIKINNLYRQTIL